MGLRTCGHVPRTRPTLPDSPSRGVLLLRNLLAIALAALAPLGLVIVGADHAAAYTRVVAITFPAEPGSTYTDDYATSRSGGQVHGATDLFNAMGTKVYAAVGGTVGWMPGAQPVDPHPTAGFALQVRGDDGRRYAYYHLGPWNGTAAQAFAPGVAPGLRVERGQHIGYLGNSGNARHAPPHLHFEIHQEGVEAPRASRINPYFSLRAAEQRHDYAGAGTPDPAGWFPDIATSVHRPAIEALAGAGVLRGRADGRFHAGDPVTRAELSSFLQRALALAEASPPFADLVGSVHAGAVGALAGSGIVFGADDGLFHPGRVVIRGQMAAFLARAYALEAAGMPPFRDIGSSTHEAAITALAEAGVAHGFANGNFYPGRPVTRGQAASMLHEVWRR